MTSDNENVSSKPDFSAFADWHVTEQGEMWPRNFGDEPLTKEQKAIVEGNVELLKVRDVWMAKTDAFEEELSKIKDEEARKKKRAEFAIRFDREKLPPDLLDFEEFHFPCSVFFRMVTFGGGNVSFSGATFEGGVVSFLEAKFGDGNVSFSGATFGDGDVSFLGVTFGDGNVSFSTTMFGDGDVSFLEAKFGDGRVLFTRAAFGDGNVSFFGTTFGEGRVSFSGATFGDGEVSFADATFECENVSFTNVRLGNADISFLNAVIKGNFFAGRITYPADADFQRMSVGGTADFSNNTFHKVPDFTDSKIERPPDVSGMEVLAFKKKWISPRWKADRKMYGDGVAAKFRKLKAMALAANDHEKDGEFFAYEMLAKRGFEAGNTGPVALFLNWLYFTFSNFGQSYLRPAIALGLNFFIFFVINALTAASFLKPTDLSSFAFWQSFKNMIPFLNSLVRFASRPDEFKTVYEMAFNQLKMKGAPIEFFINAGIFQNFIGLVLLFLLLLGLRNKFRLK